MTLRKAPPSGKVVPLRPEFVREVANLVEKSFDFGADESITSEVWTPELRAFLDGATLKSLFYSEDWVFIVVDLVASKLSSQPLVVKQRVKKGSEVVEELLPDQPLIQLFQQPNEWQDYAQWMYNTVVETVLGGNGIIWHAPRAGQLITFPFETVTMEFDERRRVVNYVTNEVTEGATGRQLIPSQWFKPDTVIHVRRPNPSSLLWGLSPFIPGRKSILFNRYSSDYLNAFYNKQATPGLSLSLERTVNEDVALRQLRSFEVAYQGRKNMRRTLILPKGVTATPLTHSLSDQNLIEHIRLNRETILGILKVPPHEAGLQTTASLGSEEYKTALRNFWEATLIPTAGLIAGALTKYFQRELGEGVFIAFDLSNVEALKEDERKKADNAAAMLQAGMSINEVRQRVWKLEPVTTEGADDPYVLASRAAAAVPASFFSVAAPETKAGAVVASPSAKIQLDERVEAFRAKAVKGLLEEEARTVKGLAMKALDMLVGMTETAIEVVHSSDKAAPLVQHKDLPSKRVLARRIEKALGEKFEEKWQTEIARTLSQSIDVGYDQQLELVLNEKARREIEALKARDKEKRRATLSARGLDSFANISASHTERIMAQVTEGVAKGESIGQIMKRVATALGTPDQLIGRAETIARTETLTAVSIGQAAALENAKEVLPGLRKVWLTAGDHRVRDTHKALDGDVVDVGAKFANGLRHPRDIQATDPAEVINCRCTLLMVPPGENVELP